MLKSEVQVGSVYSVKVSGKVQPVRLVSENLRGGWDGVNLNTNRSIRIKSGAKLRNLWADELVAVENR